MACLKGLECQRILRRLVQGLTPKIIQIKAVVARQGHYGRSGDRSQFAQGGGTQRILPLGRTGYAPLTRV